MALGKYYTQGRLRNDWIALRRLYGSHTGDNIGALVCDVLREYGIENNIGYFMLDNGGNNDTSVAYIFDELCSQLNATRRLGRRLRCLGHIINLICQSFLLQDADRTLQNLETAQLHDDAIQIAKIWQKQSPIGKLHNLVRYITASPQRREEFHAAQCEEDPTLLNDLEVCCTTLTRSSTHMILAYSK